MAYGWYNGWYNGSYDTLDSGYRVQDRLALTTFGSEDAKTLADQTLESVVKVAQAELTRRATQGDTERKRNQELGWFAFSNFLLGAVHALSAHRMLQRHTTNIGQTWTVGGKEPKGSYWTPVEISRARRSFSTSNMRAKDKAAGIPFTDVAPWERTPKEHRAVMLRKLEIEKAQTPVKKPEPVKPLLERRSYIF